MKKRPIPEIEAEVAEVRCELRDVRKDDRRRGGIGSTRRINGLLARLRNLENNLNQARQDAFAARNPSRCRRLAYYSRLPEWGT